MNPLPIETLYATCPSFLAHGIMPLADRQNAAIGDWAKVVVDFPNGDRRQIWLEVVWTNPNPEGPSYKGQLANHGYPVEWQRLFPGKIPFTAQHIYRLLKYQHG